MDPKEWSVLQRLNLKISKSSRPETTFDCLLLNGPHPLSTIHAQHHSYHRKTNQITNVSSETLLRSASSRMVTTADIEVTENKVLNMQAIKDLTGNDMSDGGQALGILEAAA